MTCCTNGACGMSSSRRFKNAALPDSPSCSRNSAQQWLRVYWPSSHFSLPSFLITITAMMSLDGRKLNRSATASGYRLYVASRPDGRHLTDAHAAVAALYERAADKYRRSASDNMTSQGVEVVIKMLEYAKSTGQYKVFVSFAGDDQIPTDVEARLRKATGISKFIPILPSFTPAMNQARETRILQKISDSFGKVIPGDILQFSIGQGSSREIRFRVQYVIKATGELYYPVSQEKLSGASRDWYTGIGFDWGFLVAVPNDESSRFQFSLKSEPAQLFNVAYTKSAGQSDELVPTEVYGAMADSAFDDFGSKLLTQLAVK